MSYDYGPDEESDKIAAGRGILVGLVLGLALIGGTAYAINLIF